VISIELENVIHRVYVLKRPGVDQFLRAVGQKFEVHHTSSHHITTHLT
jgi:RNA polymerase II subunit A small phosphatase-like protein